jgi:nuclear cap-binding protein subunit 2
MPAAVRNTVDRLDKPSAYYQSRVSNEILCVYLLQFGKGLTKEIRFQNKKRKYDRDDDVGRERTPDEPVEDPLKDATTLYVGNLWVAELS